MEIVEIQSVSQFKRNMRSFYKTSPYFKDNKSALMDLVINPKTAFCKNSSQKILAVRHHDEFLCQCTLIHHKNYANTVMISFFDAKSDCSAAVRILVDYAISFARDVGAGIITASLDGHCNYSVGFLTEEALTSPMFGGAFSPSYYNDYFSGSGFSAVKLVSFFDKLELINTKTASSLLAAADDTVIDTAAFENRKFKCTMRRYTDLSNTIFSNHRYCFYREYAEDFELFSSMRLILRPDNMIIASKNGIDAGFLLWYPDFNELVPPGKAAGISTCLQYKLLCKCPQRAIIAEMGVLPQFENSRLILQLIGALKSILQDNYLSIRTVASSWILDENTKSKALSGHLLKQKGGSRTAYELKIRG